MVVRHAVTTPPDCQRMQVTPAPHPSFHEQMKGGKPAIALGWSKTVQCRQESSVSDSSLLALAMVAEGVQDLSGVQRCKTAHGGASHRNGSAKRAFPQPKVVQPNKRQLSGTGVVTPNTSPWQLNMHQITVPRPPAQVPVLQPVVFRRPPVVLDRRENQNDPEPDATNSLLHERYRHRHKRTRPNR